MNRLLAVAIGLCLFEAATGPTSVSQPHDLVYVIDSTERMGDVFDDVRAFVSQHALVSASLKPLRGPLLCRNRTIWSMSSTAPNAWETSLTTSEHL